jgi:glycine dehydrogenase subunit 1
VCSSDLLCALAAAVYLVCLGKNLKKLAALNIQKAWYLKTQLSRLAGWEPAFTGSIYNEFAMRCPDPAAVNRKLQNEGIIGGYALEKDYPELKGSLLFCATEMLSGKAMDRIVSIVK